MGTEATASAEFLRMLGHVSRGAGLRPEAIWSGSGISASVIQQSGMRLPLSVARRAWREAGRQSGDPCFGLHAAERLGVGALDLLDYITRSAPTLGEAFARLIRYRHLLVDERDLSLTISGKHARFTHRSSGAVA